MARGARNLSISGYEHVIVRGIGKQIIFENDEDYIFYLNRLKKFSDQTEVIICAYCLMDNHVHLLVYDPKGQLPLLMKKLGVSYSKYFNSKYERCGHLFQNRYKNEVVEDEAYFITVFRYILNNPVKAGICSASKYRWSSYREYTEYEDSFYCVSNPEVVKGIIGDSRIDELLNVQEKCDVMGIDGINHDDTWAHDIINKLLKGNSGTIIQSFPREQRDYVIRVLKNEGLSIRQIERLTGINRGVIQRTR